MKISIIGPTNVENLSKTTGLSVTQITDIAESIGRRFAEVGIELITMFNYRGMLKLVGDSYVKHGGKLTMLYTDNDQDWETKPYMDNIKYSDNPVRTKDWHDLLLTLVTNTDVVLCLGLSSGVFTEMGYINWNFQEKKGAKALIGVRELIRGGEFPIEIVSQMGEFAKIVSFEDVLKFDGTDRISL